MMWLAIGIVSLVALSTAGLILWPISLTEAGKSLELFRGR